ncbi:MAG: FliH/SctL family protein [Desulfuromonadaceae bacterium]|nr:FliH/SctL family protein [Desulfuromonadaceae bacterium]MDD5104039.1 FliH/SctL family protein [Desulfuromonadaceae bacterium]
MSSSKIIKQSENGNAGFADFNFRNIGQSGVVAISGQAAPSFVPMGLFNSQDRPGKDVEEEGPPPIVISEEEFRQRLSSEFNAGLKEGKDLAERGLINVFRALRASSETIHNLREKVFRESEDEILKLVMLIARKVITREVSQDRTIISYVVKNALTGLSVREEITVRINPEDYQLVTTGRDQLLSDELLNDRLLLKPDPSVATGFCLVDTNMGTINATLEGQMEQLYRSLLEQRAMTTGDEPLRALDVPPCQT